MLQNGAEKFGNNNPYSYLKWKTAD